MAVLSWGKPKVEIAKITDGVIGEYSELPAIKEGTAQLSTTEGTETEAKEEGGALIDSRRSASTYSFTCDVFKQKGADKPIADADGIIVDNYAIRLTPEDNTVEGWIMEKTQVSCVTQWSSADGELWRYTFKGLKPASGNILKEYSAAQE
jgi:hypothetical protein